MLELTGRDYGLPEAPGHLTVPLRVIDGPPVPDVCDGSMTCGCEACVQERVARLQPRPEPMQPWTPRPARRAA